MRKCRDRAPPSGLGDECRLFNSDKYTTYIYADAQHMEHACKCHIYEYESASRS